MTGGVCQSNQQSASNWTKNYFFIKKKKNLTLRHTITKPHATLSHIQYVLQQVQRKSVSTFLEKEKKIIHSIFGSLPPLSLYAPLPFPLYRCGYLISTIDKKFLFLIAIVLCCAKVRHFAEKSKTKRKDFFRRKMKGCKDRGHRRTYFFAFCVNTDWQDILPREREKQGAAEKNWSSPSLLVSHVRTVALSVPFRTSSENGRNQMGGREGGDKTWPPNTLADPMFLIGGRVLGRARRWSVQDATVAFFPTM